MIINRNSLADLYSLINRKKDIMGDINTQYKLLKIKQYLREELEIYNQQITTLANCCEKDENGEIIQNEDGSFQAKPDMIEKCEEIIEALNNFKITLPDIYFSLDELQILNLTLGELELLDPFIK